MTNDAASKPKQIRGNLHDAAGFYQAITLAAKGHECLQKGLQAFFEKDKMNFYAVDWNFSPESHTKEAITPISILKMAATNAQKWAQNILQSMISLPESPYLVRDRSLPPQSLSLH